MGADLNRPVPPPFPHVNRRADDKTRLTTVDEEDAVRRRAAAQRATWVHLGHAVRAADPIDLAPMDTRPGYDRRRSDARLVSGPLPSPSLTKEQSDAIWTGIHEELESLGPPTVRRAWWRRAIDAMKGRP